MLTSITLQNFKSFGEAQTVPLEPITVLVGPNNSGKSNFMSVGRFMRNAQVGLGDAIVIEGGRGHGLPPTTRRRVDHHRLDHRRWRQRST